MGGVGVVLPSAGMSVLCPSGSLWRTSRGSSFRNETALKCVRDARSNGDRLRLQRTHFISGGLPLWRNTAFGVGVLSLSAHIRSQNSVKITCSSSNFGENSAAGDCHSLPQSCNYSGSQERLSSHVVFATSIAQFARNMGKALALGVVIAAVGYGSKGVAIAALAVAEEVTAEEEEVSEAEIEQFRKQLELENLERERQLRSALRIDQKVAELEAFAEEAARDSSKKELFLAKLQEAVRATYAGGRALQGQKILELNSSLEELARERDVTAKRAEEIEQEYLSLQSELLKLDD